MKDVLTTDNRGFSLVELMVTTAIVGVMATAGAQLMIQQGKQQSGMAQKAVFTALSSTVAATLSSPAAILWSTKDPTRAPTGSGNATLHTCLVPAHPDPTILPYDSATPSLTCTAGAPGTDDALFDLYQNNNSTPITGFYDLTGNRLAAVTTTVACTANPKCRFQVTAKFIPNCPNQKDPITGLQINPCNKPESLVLTYSVAQVNKPAGTTAIATVATSSASGATSPGFTMPYSMIYASSYIKADCRLLHPASAAELVIDPTLKGPPLKASPLYSTVVGVDDLGQPICGPDPNQGAIAALTQQYCQLKMAQLWGPGAGGTSVLPCPIVTVSKAVFRLTTPGNTTNDCTGSDKRIMPNGSSDFSFASGSVISSASFSSYTGGIVSGDLSETDLIAKYLLAANTLFNCQSRSDVITVSPRTWTNPGGSLALPDAYKPGSLIVTLIGGGGGGGGSCWAGGQGGHRGGSQINQSMSGVISHTTTCTVTVGTFGGGGSGGGGSGGSGGLTKISCTNGDILIASGAGAAGGGSCSGGSGSGQPGEDSAYTDVSSYGGVNNNCNGGSPGQGYGAGGGSGDSSGCSDFHSGANGSPGIATATWREYIWANWP